MKMSDDCFCVPDEDGVPYTCKKCLQETAKENSKETLTLNESNLKKLKEKQDTVKEK